MSGLSTSILLSAYPPVRRVERGASPWPGLVVRDSGGAPALLVEGATLGEDWAGWRVERGEHVLVASDVVRTPDGHAALFDLCTERLADVLDRRHSDGDPLDEGEALTVAVSVLRGHADARAVSELAGGEWWLTVDRRPVLAIGSSAADSSAGLLRSLADHVPRWAEVLEECARAVTVGLRPGRELGDLEDRLFARATPQALRTAGDRRRSASTPERSASRSPASRAAARAASGTERAGVVTRLSALFDHDLADAVSKATTGVWRALRRPAGGSRRRVTLIAGGAAAAVVAVGLMWPSEQDSSASTVSPTPPGPSTAASPTVTPSAHPLPAESTSPDDLAAVTDALLTARTVCAEDEGCLAETTADPSGAVPQGVVDLPADRRTVTLLDDFGGAAVSRVDATDGAGPSQLVVIVQIGDRWVIRDVYAAGAPS